MRNAIPQTLQKLTKGVEVIIERLPTNYARAIFNSWLASSFVYKYGLHPSEFAFFEFVSALNEQPVPEKTMPDDNETPDQKVPKPLNEEPSDQKGSKPSNQNTKE